MEARRSHYATVLDQSTPTLTVASLLPQPRCPRPAAANDDDSTNRCLRCRRHVVRLLVGASILPLSTDDPSASTAAPESGFLRQPKPSEMRTGAQNRIRVRPSQLFFSVEYAGCWFIVTPVKKHRRMLKKTNRTLFAALITLSLIGQSATAIASGCSAGHAASADTVTGATPDAVHATHDHTAVINHRGKSVSPASAGSLADCCTNLLCFLDNCATSASLSIVATLLPEPFDDSSMLSPAAAPASL